MSKIGIKNFRVFKEFTEFEIKPITLLTGPNNAGKSSFTKLLLLLKNGIKKLNFNVGLHNLESFDKVLNWENKQNTLELSFDNEIPFLTDDFKVQLTYGKNEINKISISNNTNTLLNFSFVRNSTFQNEDARKILKAEEGEDLGERLYGGGPSLYDPYVLNLNITFLIDLIYSKQLKQKFYEIKENNEVNKKTIILNDLVVGSQEIFKTTFQDLIDLHHKEIELDSCRTCALNNEINALEKNYLLYDVIANDKVITHLYQNKIIELQNSIFSDFKTNCDPFDFSAGKDLISMLKSIFPYINERVKNEIIQFFKKELQTENIKIKETALGNLIFIEKLYDQYDNYNGDSGFFQKNLFDQFSKFINTNERVFKNINYLSANRGSQKRTLRNKSENDIDEIVLDFFKYKDKYLSSVEDYEKTLSELERDFIGLFYDNNRKYFDKVLEILEIEGTLDIVRYENVISVIYIKQKDKDVALADLGFGFSQLIPIVLKIINTVESNSEILIIEEPEANLHPNLQSKLADIFALTVKTFPRLNLIIESHSEYLIRKLQYLTAKGDISPDDTSIYYFNADKYVSPQEPKVKQIEIRANGNLSDTFGPGFYDETTRLQFDLMKLNQEQNN
jgi:predicted ATPase